MMVVHGALFVLVMPAAKIWLSLHQNIKYKPNSKSEN